MKIADYLAEIEVVLCTAPPTLEVSGVCCDSRKAAPGQLFVAIRGSRDSGLAHVAQALDRGVAAIVAEEPPPPAGPRWIQVADARSAAARLACAAARHPSRAMAIHAVTGTNGKTTTAGLLRDMLAAAGHRPGLISTVQYAYGERVIAATRTTPDACELQELLAAMRDAGCDSVSMEASSHAIDQRRIGGMRFATAAFTNLSRDHLDYHRDMESYFGVKARLFDQLADENRAGVAVLNVDDPFGRRLADRTRTRGTPTLTYGFADDADLRAVGTRLDAAGSAFTMLTPSGRADVATALLGRYNVSNMLCAAGMALAAGVPLDGVARTLAAAAPRWGRLERVATPLPAAVFVDYAHTDDALAKVLDALREITAARLIVVFGCGGNRDRGKRPMMGKAAAERADHLIITSDNPRNEDPLAIIAEIVAGIPAGTSHAIVPDRREAIRAALEAGAEGDVILIAGKGHENYQEFGSRVVPFDDREQVRSLARHVR